MFSCRVRMLLEHDLPDREQGVQGNTSQRKHAIDHSRVSLGQLSSEFIDSPFLTCILNHTQKEQY